MRSRLLRSSARGYAAPPRRSELVSKICTMQILEPVRLLGRDITHSQQGLTRMTSIITTGQAAAASLSLSLANVGGKLTAVGERLKTHSAKSAKLAPAAFLLALAINPARAQAAGGTGSLDSFLNNVVNMITGSTGQAIAIIAVALCGLGAMFGALSARAFGGVVLGCAIVFSAAWVVQKITGAA